MERDQYELLGDLGIVANGNSWCAPDTGKCWFVFLQSLQAHAQEGFLSGTFLRNMKRSFDGPSDPFLIHVKDGPCLLVGQAGKMCTHYGDVSALMMRCAGYNYTRYCSRRCQKKD
uniref:Uncharacterized protein n=1 Tax=Chromera velia CCMP2878 TaxID=1169474 RepID=A0A0G4HRU7_9ALVE|eukprot:Cvel_8181.t1-p1 / transcript=Cvel_8181.t1 / gene=Cvel_8181 / organism=Chromera_velia_CCMP2878 / gene_product=hypothetical protein / transcript_product=hypothetical protein / location=Cvel_scaffold446:11258-11599(-) / protein_length=114 / sequence_SO=supercontig / SO=protein_coding / is_pseudo=false